MSQWIKINNVGNYICGDFTPTGTPYNFTIQDTPRNTQGGPFFTGWNTAPINPSDSIYAIKLSSGSYVEITYNPSNYFYGLLWEGLNFRPELVGVRQGEPFALYSGITPLYQLSTLNTPVKVSGFLPRQYNYLILRPVIFSSSYGTSLPIITVSGDFGFFAPSPGCVKIQNVGTNICATNPINCIKILNTRRSISITNITINPFNLNFNIFFDYINPLANALLLQYSYDLINWASDTNLPNINPRTLSNINTQFNFVYFRALENLSLPLEGKISSIVTFDNVNGRFYNYIVRP